MDLNEALNILDGAGYLYEARGKTNIEDFNKMKADVSKLTNIAGSNFEFITGNVKGSEEDKRSTMKLGWNRRNQGMYTYDTGRPGFNRYRKISLEKVIELIKNAQKELESLGYNVEFTDGNVKIWMPKSDFEPVEDERDITMFGIFNDGGNCYSANDEGNWYWSASEGETAAEFKARLKRSGEHKAQQNYREYVKSPTYGVKIFKDIEKFKQACEKVGLNPNLRDYE